MSFLDFSQYFGVRGNLKDLPFEYKASSIIKNPIF